MDAVRNWFRFCDLDPDSDDAQELERLEDLAAELLAIADVHLTLLTNRLKPADPEPETVPTVNYTIWVALTSQMASELYLKSGVVGIETTSALGTTVRHSMEYSSGLLRMIAAQKKLFTVA